MEDTQRNVTIAHAIDEALHGFLVVVGHKAGRQPKPERPLGQHRRTASQSGVLVENLFRCRTIDDQIFEILADGTELNPFDRFTANLERDPAGVVDEDAVTRVGQIERDVLISLFTAGSAVFIPDIDGLTILNEGCESFAKTINLFANAERHLGRKMVVAIWIDDKAQPARALVCDDFVIGYKL